MARSKTARRTVKSPRHLECSILEKGCENETWTHTRIAGRSPGNSCRYFVPKSASPRHSVTIWLPLVAELGEKYRRLPGLERNDASVVLLVEANESAVLLGGDLERPGWLDILADDQNPGAKADVFKVPHHGSETAQVDQIWTDLLIDDPLAILTPFKNGSVLLPTSANVDYILSYTDQAYSTARPPSGNRPRRGPAVESTIRETGATIRPIPVSDGIIRLRKKLDASSEWSVETFGAAGHLRELGS